MKKKIFIFILAVSLAVPLWVIRAEEDSVEQIQARINTIVERIKYLRDLLGEDSSIPEDSQLSGIIQLPASQPTSSVSIPAPAITPVIDLKYDLAKGKNDAVTNGEVSILQTYLTDQDFYGFPITGKFGNETYLAVIDFQNEYTKYLGINRGTGYVGPATRKLIKALTSGSDLTSLSIVNPAVFTVIRPPAVRSVQTVADLPAPSLVFPLGGEKWPTGGYQNIRWSGSAASYDVYAGNQKIASKITNNNFFWRVGQVGSNIPLEVGQIFKLKVCNQGSAKCSAEHSFQIVKNDSVISYRISTDKYAYDFNEGIKVSIVARNNDPIKKTLNFNTGCQVNYKVYSLDTQKVVFDYTRTRSCTKEYTYVDIDPNGSYSWFIYHDSAKYRLNPGNYVFRAEVDGNTVASTDVTIQ